MKRCHNVLYYLECIFWVKQLWKRHSDTGWKSAWGKNVWELLICSFNGSRVGWIVGFCLFIRLVGSPAVLQQRHVKTRQLTDIEKANRVERQSCIARRTSWTSACHATPRLAMSWAFTACRHDRAAIAREGYHGTTLPPPFTDSGAAKPPTSGGGSIIH